MVILNVIGICCVILEKTWMTMKRVNCVISLYNMKPKYDLMTVKAKYHNARADHILDEENKERNCISGKEG